MSTILDALKKSERERTVLRGLGFSDAGWRPAHDIDWLRWIVVGGIVVAVLVAATFVLLRTGIVSIQSPTVTVATPTSPSVEAPATTAVAAPLAENDVPALPSAPSADATVAPVSPINSSKVEFLHGMSAEFQQAVPAMTVNIHVYAPDKSHRILYINNRAYRGGDEIPGGVRVEEIVPEGVILQFQGQRFKLARPS